jgi:hypothetical protein
MLAARNEAVRLALNPCFGALWGGGTSMPRIDFTWIETVAQKPAVKERLLLMLGDAQVGESDVKLARLRK